MTIPRIPGWFDEIKEPFQQIVSAVQRVRNPHLAFQRAVMAKIAEDPDYLQKLADSGIDLDQFGLQNLKPTIEKLGESPQRRRAKAEASVAEVKGAAYTDLQPGTKDYDDMRRSTVGLPNSYELETHELNKATSLLSQQYNRIRILTEQNVLDAQKSELESNKIAEDYLRSLARTNPRLNLFEEFANSRFDPAVSASLMKSPVFMNRLKMDQSAWESLRQDENEKERLRIMRSNNNEDMSLKRLLNQMRKEEAVKLSVYMRGEVGAEEIFNVLNIPGVTVSGLREMAKTVSPDNPSVAGPQEQSLLRVGRAYNKLEEEEIKNQSFAMLNKMRGQLIQINMAMSNWKDGKGGGQAAVQFNVDAYNDLAKMLPDKEPVFIEWTPQTGFLFKKGGTVIYKTDSMDKVVDPQMLDNPKPSSNDPRVQDAVNKVNSAVQAGGNLEEALKIIEMNDPNLARLVRQALGSSAKTPATVR